VNDRRWQSACLDGECITGGEDDLGNWLVTADDERPFGGGNPKRDIKLTRRERGAAVSAQVMENLKYGAEEDNPAKR